MLPLIRLLLRKHVAGSVVDVLEHRDDDDDDFGDVDERRRSSSTTASATRSEEMAAGKRAHRAETFVGNEMGGEIVPRGRGG